MSANGVHKKTDFSRLVLGAVSLLSMFMLQQRPACAETALELAKRFLSSYRYNEAFIILRSAAKQNPKDPEVHYLLAQTIDRGHVAAMRRAVREYQLYCQLDPTGLHYIEAQNVINNWQNAVSHLGKEKVFSNLDFQDEQYYRNSEYHSWDEIPEPIGVAKRRLKQNVSLIFDTEFISPRLTETGLNAANPTAKWTGQFLREFNQRWKETATTAGQIEAYFFVNEESQLIPYIVHFSGTPELKDQFFKVVHSFDGSPTFTEPARLRTIFKGLIAARYANGNEGTYCSFKSSDAPTVRYMAHFHATFRKDSAQGLQVSNPNVQFEPLPKVETEQINVLPKPLTALEESHLKTALEEMRVGDVQQAIDDAWPAAEKDDLRACLLMADLYHTPYISFVWLEKAAQLGDENAQYKVAHAYEWGNGTLSGDINDGIIWLRKGAAKGDNNCQCELGILYEMGDSVPRDLKIAQAWYSLAADKNLDAAEGLKHINTILASGAGVPYIGSLSDAISQVQANLNTQENTPIKTLLKQPVYLKELVGYKLKFFKTLRIESGQDTAYIAAGEGSNHFVNPPQKHTLKIKLRKAAGPQGTTVDSKTCWIIEHINQSVLLVNDPNIEYLELYTPGSPDAVCNLTLAFGNMIQLQSPAGELLQQSGTLNAPRVLGNNNVILHHTWTQPEEQSVNNPPKYELCTNSICLHDFSSQLASECLKEMPRSRSYNFATVNVFHMIKYPYPNWYYWSMGVAEALSDVWKLQRATAMPGNVVSLGRNYLTAPGKVDYTKWQDGDTITDTTLATGWTKGTANIQLTIKSDGAIKAQVINSDFNSRTNHTLLRSIERLSNHPAIIFPNEFPTTLTAEDINLIRQKQQIYGGVDQLPHLDSVTFICTIRPN